MVLTHQKIFSNKLLISGHRLQVGLEFCENATEQTIK